jgi:hypothetical protein
MSCLTTKTYPAWSLRVSLKPGIASILQLAAAVERRRQYDGGLISVRQFPRYRHFEPGLGKRRG